MSEELEPTNTGIGKKFLKIIMGFVAVFFIFMISTAVIAVNDPSIKPIALLVAAFVSIFAFKQIMK